MFVGKTANVPTSEVGSVAERGCDDAVGRDDIDDALLDEEHAVAEGAFLDDGVSWLEDLELEQGHHTRHEVGVSTHEERHGRHEVAAVVVGHVLYDDWD